MSGSCTVEAVETGLNPADTLIASRPGHRRAQDPSGARGRNQVIVSVAGGMQGDSLRNQGSWVLLPAALET